MTSSLFPSLDPCEFRLTPLIMSYNEMLPGILETPENKQQLFDEMKPRDRSGNKERCLARKDLPGGRVCFVRINCYSSTKRPRGGEPTTTYSCYVTAEVYEPRPLPFPDYLPPYKLVGNVFTKYGYEVQDADALWAAVCEALKVQSATPGNLCTHCYGREVFGPMDTCWTCALGLQLVYEAMGEHGKTPIRVEDRKTPKPRP